MSWCTRARFTRASDGFRTPTLDDLAGGAGAGGNVEAVPVGDVFQVEGGFKISLPGVQSFITGFYSDIENLPFTEPVNDVTETSSTRPSFKAAARSASKRKSRLTSSTGSH